MVVGGAAAGAGVAASDPVTALAGRYERHFRNGMVDGSTHWSDNVVEIVPLDADHAYVRFSLQFYNDHSCGLAGVAHREGAALVYEAAGDDAAPTRCRLVIRREGAKLAWSDGEGGCRAFCGVRGSLLHGDLPWQSRRPIRYMARLRASPRYRDAIAAWRGAR